VRNIRVEAWREEVLRRGSLIFFFHYFQERERRDVEELALQELPLQQEQEHLPEENSPAAHFLIRLSSSGELGPRLVALRKLSGSQLPTPLSSYSPPTSGKVKKGKSISVVLVTRTRIMDVGRMTIT
jgi:hypothetical protein